MSVVLHMCSILRGAVTPRPSHGCTGDVVCNIPSPPRLEWNRLKQVYQQLQKQEMSRAKKLLAEYRESTPRPPHAAKGGGMSTCML